MIPPAIIHICLATGGHPSRSRQLVGACTAASVHCFSRCIIEQFPIIEAVNVRFQVVVSGLHQFFRSFVSVSHSTTKGTARVSRPEGHFVHERDHA
jgi:hypothetical protein